MKEFYATLWRKPLRIFTMYMDYVCVLAIAISPVWILVKEKQTGREWVMAWIPFMWPVNLETWGLFKEYYLSINYEYLILGNPALSTMKESVDLVVSCNKFRSVLLNLDGALCHDVNNTLFMHVYASFCETN